MALNLKGRRTGPIWSTIVSAGPTELSKVVLLAVDVVYLG